MSLEPPLDGRLFGEDQPCFGCGPRHPAGFHLAFTVDGDDVVTRFTPDSRYQGPPGLMHGGLVATLADELAAWVLVVKKGKFGFTAKMDLRFRAGLRIGLPVEGRGRHRRDGRRVVHIEVVLRQGETVCAEGDLTFVVLDQPGAERLLGGPIPEAWQRFCR